ncbi:MAG: DUF3188 domain-containing protein [Aphanocapsa feldmannii 277cV]|uniref:DUF3188 domain-containing protein n=2 Tax=Aphanocapsa feldmannii TaxID=192050 RepID=A0A524RKU0_9CHRO|nr:MAG: DUF3188 domain-containing protein [Aphanocapsa feldmannii 288cV]TGG90490.1 MAG: DUF3188 domain-containing protein [Aphanocapsa feldmannii 277cV]TGH27568.1 MAG: DUF3188 domain-containing protein [Aphanocapsa feldmannii 277cI]
MTEAAQLRLRLLLSLAAPLLVLFGLVGMAQRQGPERLKPLPPVLLGLSLMAASSLRRRYHRRLLLEALRNGDPSQQPSP